MLSQQPADDGRRILGIRFSGSLHTRVLVGAAVGLLFGAVLGVWAGPRSSLLGFVAAGCVGWVVVGALAPTFKSRLGAIAATAVAASSGTSVAWLLWGLPLFYGEIVFIGVMAAVGYGVLVWPYDSR